MKWRGRVAEYIDNKAKDTTLHATLIDPDKIEDVNRLVKLVSRLADAGTDIILIGGSIGVTGTHLDKIIKTLGEAINIPIVLFPGNISGISRYADAILFMSLLNSNNPYYIIGAQMQAAPIIAKYGLEVLPTAYIIVGYGGTASHVGYATPIPWDNIDLAVAYSLAAKFLGMKYVYLEAGSGSPRTVSPEMVKAVRKYVPGIRIIVGGGIRSPEQARTLAKSGAHIIVTGTIVETDFEKAAEIIESIKSIL